MDLIPNASQNFSAGGRLWKKNVGNSDAITYLSLKNLKRTENDRNTTHTVTTGDKIDTPWHTDDLHRIRRAQQGDTEAFGPLVDKYHPKIYTHIYKIYHQ